MANGYSAGDLNLSIQTIANDTLKSLDAVIERLNFINNGLTKISGITSANRSRNRTGGGSEKKYVTDSSGKRYLALEKNVTSAGKAIERTTTKFVSQNREINKNITTIDEYGNKLIEVFNYKNRKNTLLDIGKWTAVLYTARKLGRITADIVQSGANYAETLNLWQVAMGDYTNKATIFVNKMNEAYGISEKTLMNAQATFKNMLGSLGNITDDMSYQLSESVTRMAIDYASLYNVGIEEAMTKFQAALAGQVRPIRSVSGYDITENTLYQLYQSIGGTKTVRQLSQTEKRLLAIYAIFNQMDASGAIGDMKRTINSFANQSRIMAESFTEVKSYSGLIATDLIETLGIMTSINSVLAFISEFLKGIATLMGAVKGQGGGVFESTTESANEASKAIDEVNGKLLGFDKFRSLSGTEQKQDVAIDETLANAMKSYNSAQDESVLKSRQIAREWLENNGLIYDAKTGTYELNTEFESTVSLLSIILSTVLGIITVLGSKGIIGLVAKITTSFSGLGGVLSKIFDPKTLGIGLLVGLLYYLYTTNEDFRESVNLLFEVLLDAFSNIIEPIVGLLITLTPILTEILTFVAEILSPVIEIIANVIKFLDQAGVLKGVLTAIAIAIGAITLAVWANNLAWLASPVTWIVLGIVAAIALLGVTIASVIENIDEIWKTIKGLARAIGNFFANIFIGIANLFIGAVNFVIDLINIIIKPIDDIMKLLGKGGFKIPNWDAKIEYNPIPEFKDGGLPDKGSLFIANEAGAEIVYNNSNGQSGVVNVQQIAQATYQGTMSALRDWWGGTGAKGDIPQLREANPTGMYEAVTGVAKSYGNKWSQY